MEENRRVMDHGYSWVICGVTFFNFFFLMLGGSSLSVLYPEFRDHFSSTNAETSLIGSLMGATGAFSGVILAPLVTKFGSRPISIAGSIVASLGYGICYFAQSTSHLLVGFGVFGGLASAMFLYSGTILLHHYFNRRRTLAVAIACCGINAATLTLPPIARWLISTYGWRTTMIIFSAIVLQSAIGGSLMRPQNYGTQSTIKNFVRPKNEEETSTGCCASFIQSGKGFIKSVWINLDVSIFLDRRFVVFLLGSSMFGYHVPVMFTPSFARRHLGMSLSRSAWLVSVIGGSTLVGQVVSGILGDRIPLLNRPGKRLLQYAIPCLVNGLTIVAVCLVRNEAGMFAFCVAFGFTLGCYIVTLQPVMVDLFGLENLPKIFTFEHIYNGILFLVAQPFAGWLVDISGGFILSFVVCGILQSLAAFCMFLLLFVRRSKKTVGHETHAEEENIHTIPGINGKDANSSEDDHLSTTEMTTVDSKSLGDEETQ